MIEQIKTTKIRPALWNYKTDNKGLTLKLINNIKRNGFVELVLVRQVSNGYEVVNGCHRLYAAQFLKLESVPCYDLGPITLNQAKRIAVETNETRFESDTQKLSNILADILDNFDTSDLANTLPFINQETNDEPIEAEPEAMDSEPLDKACRHCGAHV